MTNNFDAALGNDPLLNSRWEACREKVLADAKRAGLEVDAESLKNLSGVKMAVFTDMGLPSDIMQELATLPAVRQQLERREALEQLNRGDSELQARLQTMSPDRRMSYARELEAQRAYTEPKPAPFGKMTAEDEARAILMLRNISDPAQRLSTARSIGLC